MMKQYIVSIDIGTTSAKAVIFSEQGDVLSEFESFYSIYHPKQNWAEQNPEEIERAARIAISTAILQKGIKPEEVIALSFSTAMHSLICMEKDQAISPMIIWADGRSYSQAEIMKSSYGKEIYRNTGTPIHPMSPFLKLIWMKENRYEPYLRASMFVSIKEYILYKWTGEWVVDYSIASASGLMNLHTLDWDEQTLEIAGVQNSQLSKIVPCTESIGPLKREVANDLFLSEYVPVIIGSSDGVLANIGVGAIKNGETALTIGTSGAIRRFSSDNNVDIDQRTFTYRFSKEACIIGGASNNGAVLLQWLATQFSNLTKKESISISDLEKIAFTSPPGANGLFFMPYLSGERAPKWNAKAKGGWIGLTLAHSSADMVRSVMESVIYNMYEIHDSLEGQAGETNKLLVSGGFARSELWLQMTADIFQKQVHVPSTHQSSAWGAAWLALYSLGKVNSIEEIKNYIPITQTIEPVMLNAELYEEKFAIFKEVYRLNKPLFKDIDILQQ
ncbi:gluconokinase [Bacillus alkalisoli]|uniref:gluconokinase n=1 Tax=Bacillus alkalisoli TaxID=2011008 RepID=UPI000C249ED0|nr:gluconokinase [Bacillus alkalisoli]